MYLLEVLGLYLSGGTFLLSRAERRGASGILEGESISGAAGGCASSLSKRGLSYSVGAASVGATSSASGISESSGRSGAGLEAGCAGSAADRVGGTAA